MFAEENGISSEGDLDGGQMQVIITVVLWMQRLALMTQLI